MIGWGRTAMKKMKAIQAMPAVIALCLALSGCSASKEVPADRYHLSVMTYSYTEEPMKGEVGQQILHKVEEYTGTELDIDWVSSTNYSQKLSTCLLYTSRCV